MNKKKLVAGLLTSASVLGICLSGGTAFADNVTDQDTQVGIGFGEHITGGPEDGELQIAWLPKEFNFGSGKTPDASLAVDYDVTGGAKKYVVVSDERPGVGVEKWELTAKLGDLKTTTGNKLAGATINFAGAMKGYAGNKAPEDPASVIAPGSRTATVPTGTISLAQGATGTLVMEDTVGTSYKGKTALEMTNIKLNVPGGAALDNQTYTGTVTWSLDDTL